MLLVLSGGPGQPGLSDPRPLRRQGARGGEEASTGSSSSTSVGRARARSTARRCSSRWAHRISTRRPPQRCARARRRSATRRQFYGTDDVVADIDALRQALGVDKIALDGISYGTYVGERYALAHPDHVSKLVLDSVVPHVGLSDLGVVEFRGTARVLRSVCGKRCVNDLAAVVKRYHNGVDILDALTTDSIVDPTYKTVFDVPQALRAARNGAPGLLESFIVEHARRRRRARGCARPGAARERALRRLALSVGNVVGTARRPCGRARPRGREAARVGALPVRPRDRDRQRVHPPVPSVGADAADAARPRQDHRPDAPRERQPRSLDAARVGEAGARAHDARQARRRAGRRPLDAVAFGQ